MRTFSTGLLFVALAFSGSPAFADGETRIDVELGKTVVVEVGSLRGLICDDLTIINADLRNKDEQTNELVLTGLKLGTTACRVGAAYLPFHMYEVHVVPAKHR